MKCQLLCQQAFIHQMAGPILSVARQEQVEAMVWEQTTVAATTPRHCLAAMQWRPPIRQPSDLVLHQEQMEILLLAA